jgi:hypothetical protein
MEQRLHDRLQYLDSSELEFAVGERKFGKR